MRNILSLVSACMAAGFILSVMPSSVMAAPGASLATSTIVPEIIEKAGWRRRYYRRHRYLPPPPAYYAPEGPSYYVPEAPLVDEEVLLVPVRPSSCGEFYYWNGEACVDARYYDPYLGPR